MKTEKNKMPWPKLCEALRAIDKDALYKIALVSEGDGHTIFKPEAYAQAGMPDEVLAYFTRTYESDTSDPKATITGNDGAIMAECKGVYGLTVLETIVTALGLSQSPAMGRGWRARHAFSVIGQHCGKVGVQ